MAEYNPSFKAAKKRQRTVVVCSYCDPWELEILNSLDFKNVMRICSKCRRVFTVDGRQVRKVQLTK